MLISCRAGACLLAVRASCMPVMQQFLAGYRGLDRVLRGAATAASEGDPSGAVGAFRAQALPRLADDLCGAWLLVDRG
jgi:hypothetical protein